MDNLGDALPKEIDRVRMLQDQYRELRRMPNVIVEPQIAMMEAAISSAIKSLAIGDVVAMLKAYSDLKEWRE